jgi:hypothetical protein
MGAGAARKLAAEGFKVAIPVTVPGHPSCKLPTLTGTWGWMSTC